MDIMLEALLPYEGGIIPDDIPETEETIWILGTEYKPPHDIEALREIMRSIIWCSYRRDFDPIDTTAYRSDSGWGCMIRCGQMMLARAYLAHHKGAKWIWTPETLDHTYLRIINLFEDRYVNSFSIQRITIAGIQEGKKIGQWFGPNTIAQVLRRLAFSENWTGFLIHVALDGMVIISVIKKECKGEKEKEKDQSQSKSQSQSQPQPQPQPQNRWRPLLLIVPIRLGMTNISPNYFEPLKRCFTIKYSVGVLGGTPRHALYFFGYVGEEVFYLDPHTTQPTVKVGEKLTWEQVAADATYHCDYAMREKLSKMDPSMAVGFLCSSEKDFDTLCTQLEAKKITTGSWPLFQVYNENPFTKKEKEQYD